MQLKIVQVGDPVLRQQAQVLSKADILSPGVQNLIFLMQATMRDAPGVGLAAPQIGESIQLLVIEDREEYTRGVPEELLIARERSPVPFHVLINPKITSKTKPMAQFYEGCLSVSPFLGEVPRALEVTVEALNEKAEPISINARGWYARILQHEIDHLHGVLCIDHMDLRTLTTVENYQRSGGAVGKKK